MQTLTKALSLAISIIIAFPPAAEAQSPVEYARAVADRIIRDASFSLREVDRREPGFPLICFPGAFAPQGKPGSCFVDVEAPEPGIYLLGFSADEPFEVRQQGETVFISGNKGNKYPKEIAYDSYEFREYHVFPLDEGGNRLEIISRGTVSLGVVDQDGMKDTSFSYGRPEYPQGANKESAPSKEYRYTVPEHAAFRNHPYTEWHYANGATMTGLQYLSDLTDEERYGSFVDLFCRTNLGNLELFRQQYDSGSLYTQNYRLFRCTMLDDSSAPALPYMERYLRGSLDAAQDLIEYIAGYVANEQTRLPDGTFVRPEPKWTLWADDLFMSVPFMIRYAKQSGNDDFIEDAVLQIINYDKYLYDDSRGLYHHGWYVYPSLPAGSYWGRANGWIAWAVSEALSMLPSDHPQYGKILDIHTKQLRNIVKYQAASGRWHQLLHDKNSYEETSCTALFTLAIAKAVRMGWLPAEYGRYALKGWDGISGNIDIENGVVRDICKSTAIGPDEEFYRKQARRDNDPRGLGAVLTAAVETQMLMQYLK